MEKPTCKLCSRTFSNGRALGGHMRSHVTQKPQQQEEENESSPSSSSSSSSSEDEEKTQTQSLYYELRENPKKSFRVIDPEFFAIDSASIVQDRESETESSKNPFLNRSDPEPVSSVSDTTPEEDVAICLMLLSRDQWMKKKDCRKSLNKYKCGTCKKVFRSYQALGGHRASHKKIRTWTAKFQGSDSETRNAVRIHECPVCFRVFKSGQALGGHKRSHLIASASVSQSATAAATDSVKLGENLIDLNLPAPIDDDDFSQIELSAVSDAEFVDPAK